jgi:two-component system, LytTR family, response regulator
MMKEAKQIPLYDFVNVHETILDLQNQIAELQNDLQRNLTKSTNTSLDKGVFVGLNSTSKFIRIKEVTYISASSNYSTIHLTNGESILTSKTLKHWVDKFNSAKLIRIHQTYLVNLDHITSISFVSNSMLMGNLKLPISRSGKKLIKNIQF